MGMCIYRCMKAIKVVGEFGNNFLFSSDGLGYLVGKGV